MGSQSGSEDEGTDFSQLIAQFTAMGEKQQKTKQKKVLNATTKLVQTQVVDLEHLLAEMDAELKGIAAESLQSLAEIDAASLAALKNMLGDACSFVEILAEFAKNTLPKLESAREEDLANTATRLNAIASEATLAVKHALMEIRERVATEDGLNTGNE